MYLYLYFYLYVFVFVQIQILCIFVADSPSVLPDFWWISVFLLLIYLAGLIFCKIILEKR